MPDETKCPDCGAVPGSRHESGCDVARCTECGVQDLMCDEHEGEMQVWTGAWPGEAECHEYGWFAYFVPYGNPSWQSCDKDHPEAAADFNRLAREARWDKDRQRFVRK